MTDGFDLSRRQLLGLGLTVLCSAGVSAPVLAAGEPAPATPAAPAAAPAAAGGEPLPPLAKRLPKVPLVLDLPAMGRRTGRPGGSIVTLISRVKDARMITVWGYARLVGYDQQLEIVPDILESLDVEEGRRFTLHLRPGHRWSDGKPFTAEDFRYFWEDIVLNKELTPAGPEPFLLVEGRPPLFEVIDDVTVRYTWDKPNSQFLPSLAAARDPFIYRPAHYLKHFHIRYADKAELDAKVKKKKARSWAALHVKMDSLYEAMNPSLPSLQPWIATESSSDRRLVMARNHYFHRVDQTGQQLPYADNVVMNVVASGLIASQTQAGQSDLQARGLSFSDITVLKRGGARSGIGTRLWPISMANQVALYPNLTVSDPVWRTLLRDVRFRRALSLGIDRDMINRVLFFGMARPSNNAVLAQSQLFRPEYRTLWASYDPDYANRLLDDMGLTDRRSDGIRMIADDRPLQIVVEAEGTSQEQMDVLQLVAETWQGIGVSLFAKASDRDIMWKRALAGSLVMMAANGYDNGIPTSAMSPAERVPADSSFLSGMAWGAWRDSEGKAGERIDYPPVYGLLTAFQNWLSAPDKAQREAAWRTILDIHVNQVLTIGIVAGVHQPVAVRDNLINVPEDALWGFDPGAFFGIYHMDCFWFDQQAKQGS